jgi:23S rRNA (uracil1939-C5)-methyltransferase
VEQILRRIGRLVNPPVRPIIASPKPYHYRNRITVHVDDGIIGYYRRDVHQLIDVEICPISTSGVNAALIELRSRRPRDGHYTLRDHDGPRVFEQTNDEVAAILAQLVEGFLRVRQHLLIDAYCGAGFFAKRLAHQFERVIGVEWDRFAVAAARESALPNEMYVEGDVDLELHRCLAGADLAKTAVIVDPPATGLTNHARRALLDHPPNSLVYVSCNPATMARDLADLQQRFTINSITPLDMFPQTAEIECVADLKATLSS